jgi:hypothetical protein
VRLFRGSKLTAHNHLLVLSPMLLAFLFGIVATELCRDWACSCWTCANGTRSDFQLVMGRCLLLWYLSRLDPGVGVCSPRWSEDEVTRTHRCSPL